MSFLVAPKVHSNGPSLAGAERSVGPDPIRLTSPDVITPELALVSPELAAAARGRLPDRPWEVALHRARASGVRAVGSEARAPTLSVPRDAPTAPPAADGPAVRAQSDPQETETTPHRERARVETPVADGRTHRRRLVRGLVLAALVVGGLVVGVPRLDVWTGGSEERVLTTTPPVRTTSPETQGEAPSSLLPSAGYVVSPGGSFMTGATGRTIEFFTLPLRCGSRQLVIQDIPVSGPSLRFTGKAVGQAITVRLSGRLLDRERVRGVVAADGSLCSSGPVAFTARLS